MILTRSKRSRLAVGLAVVWLCAWLAPLVHQVECGGHDDDRCPICQFAGTSLIAAPRPVAPALAWNGTPHLPHIWTPAFAQLFQREHPPQGPPPVFSSV
jgi:hypothetical protein